MVRCEWPEIFLKAPDRQPSAPSNMLKKKCISEQDILFHGKDDELAYGLLIQSAKIILRWVGYLPT
jgi:hypothetical protein